MLSHTLKNSSSPPIPAGYKVNDDISQNNSESSALTSEINFVGNSRQALSIQKNTSIPLTDGFLTRTWRSLQASDGEHSRGNISDEEGTELTEILTMGETLRQQANSLCAPSNEAPVPLAWKGSILKRCLVGVGFLTGAGVLGGAGYAGYKYYNARAANTGAPGKGLQPGALHTTLEAVKMQESYGGSLEDSFGHHALHHDASTNRTRHNRRHQPESAYNTTESKLNDDGSKNNVKSTLQKKNHRVKKLLRSAELLSDQIPVPKEKMLYAVSLYLHYNDADINNERNIKLLAQEILSGSGIYGENKNEKLSTEQAKSVVRHWVFQNILGSTPEKYVESRMKMDISKSYTVNDIHRLLPVDTLPVVSSFYPERLSQFEQLFLSIMWKNLLIEEMPFLIFSNKKIISMPLNSFDFANLYSGSRFIKDIKGENVTSEETISTGESIWDLAISEGISEDKLKYYRTPAILFYATVPSGEIESEQVNDINIINNYLNYRTEIDAIKKDIDKKYNTYLSATKLWLSKGELADKIIAHCPNLKQLLNDRINAALTSEQRKEESRKTAKQYYLNGWGKPCDFAPDNIDDNYTQSTTNVANGFREIDKYLILSGINTISENELEFISSPKAIIHLARLVINTSSATRFIINSDTSKEIDIPLNNADLFSVQQDDQERIYTLQKTEDSQKGYRLIRIDRNITEYIINDIFHEDFKKEYIYHSPYVKIKENNFNELYRFIKEPITIKIDNIKSIVDSLSNIHRIALFNNLYESGNDRSDLEKVWSVVKQIIPFYYCIEQSIEGNNGEAVPACLMDIISLVPVAGQASELGGKFAMGLGRGFLSGAVSLSKEGIKATGKNILRGIAIPTTAELASLGKSTLISLDPGFSLLMSTSSVSRTFAEKIVNFIHGKKEMTALAKSLDTRISKLPLITPDKQVVGILPGTELEIPVAAIGKQDGKSIYVKINPETGEKFGAKYICRGEGMLFPATSLLGRYKRSETTPYMNGSANDTYHRVKRMDGNRLRCSSPLAISPGSQYYINNYDEVIDIGNIPQLNEFLTRSAVHPYRGEFVNFNRDISDVANEMKQKIRSYYQREDFFAFSLNQNQRDIPAQYTLLRDRLGIYRYKVNRAKELVETLYTRFRDIETHKYHRTPGVHANSILIGNYLSDLLRINTINDINIQEIIKKNAMTRLQNYVHDMNSFFQNEINNIYFVTANISPYNLMENASPERIGGFVFSNDESRRVIIMADFFSVDDLDRQLTETILHEASHLSGSLDYKLSNVGDALASMARFNNVALGLEPGHIELTDSVMEYYQHTTQRKISKEQLRELIRRDPVLRANLFMDNAYFLPVMIERLCAILQ